MELFLLLPNLQSIHLFYKRFVITSKDSKNGFWKQEMELSKQEMDLFLLLHDLHS